MNILTSIITTVIVLAIVLPLFYIYIISKARQRLEKETTSSVKEELNSLVKEFNRISLSNISMLENLTIRAKKILREIEQREQSIKNKKSNLKNKSSKESDKENSYGKNLDDRYISYNQELNIRREPRFSVVSDDDVKLTVDTSNKENLILDMYKLGLSNEEIASKVGYQVGEVEVILAMHIFDYGQHEQEDMDK